MVKSTKIRNIKIHYLKNKPKKKYFDQSEKFLFDFFNKPQSDKEEEIEKLLQGNPPWPIPYHLSPQRQHLLDWYPFKKDASILDIGAGCGALTGLFSHNLKRVVCLELTDIRAQIIAKRWGDRDNIEVYCGLIEDFNPQERFDYVNLTGVLEYAGMFYKNGKDENVFADAPVKFLNKVSNLVKKGGTVFIAIENPLGIRYFTGSVEDHYGELFEGLENYPQYKGIRTFTQKELVKLAQQSGFSDLNLYFPIPDYKFPTFIMSEEYLKKHNCNSLSSMFQSTESSNNPQFRLFSEILLSYQLLKEDILEHCLNSFLLISRKI